MDKRNKKRIENYKRTKKIIRKLNKFVKENEFIISSDCDTNEILRIDDEWGYKIGRIKFNWDKYKYELHLSQIEKEILNEILPEKEKSVL